MQESRPITSAAYFQQKQIVCQTPFNHSASDLGRHKTINSHSEARDDSLAAAMSLFRRPKKANVQRRVFSAIDEDENNDNSDGGNENAADSGDGIKTPPPPALSDKHDKKPKSVTSSSGKSSSKQKPSLLSFGDEGRHTQCN